MSECIQCGLRYPQECGCYVGAMKDELTRLRRENEGLQGALKLSAETNAKLGTTLSQSWAKLEKARARLKYARRMLDNDSISVPTYIDIAIDDVLQALSEGEEKD